MLLFLLLCGVSVFAVFVFCLLFRFFFSFFFWASTECVFIHAIVMAINAILKRYGTSNSLALVPALLLLLAGLVLSFLEVGFASASTNYYVCAVCVCVRAVCILYCWLNSAGCCVCNAIYIEAQFCVFVPAASIDCLLLLWLLCGAS